MAEGGTSEGAGERVQWMANEPLAIVGAVSIMLQLKRDRAKNLCFESCTIEVYVKSQSYKKVCAEGGGKTGANEFFRIASQTLQTVGKTHRTSNHILCNWV